MKPLVSIIIPSYNHSHFIVQTLDSVAADTYFNKEIVVLDDGSKDDSIDVINQWILNNNSSRVRFNTRENRGLCSTLNELVNLAKGKYLVILASDDLLINDAIAERVAFLENSDKMVIFSDAEVIDQNGNLTHKSMLFDLHKRNKENYTNQNTLLDEIIFNFSISGAVMMMDKDIFSIIGKYPEGLKAEDLYFYISVAAKDQLLFYNKAVSRYRIHGANTSNWENPELLVAIIATYKKLFFRIPGFKRKLKLLKRLVGITLKKYKLIK